MGNLRRNSPDAPPRILLYGTEGVGKTTIAAGAPGVVFAELEEGLGLLDVPTFGLLSSYSELMDVIKLLATQPHDFQTLAIDSLDWLERVIWNEVCRRNNWKGISDPQFGKGYEEAANVWKEILEWLGALRNERQMGLILIAHAAIRKFESPETAPYERYTPKLHESNKGIGANPMIREHVDAVFFNGWKVSILNDKTSNDKKDIGHNRGVGGGQRVLYTQERPASLAKNRWSMPPEIVLPNNPAESWNTIAQYIPYYAARMNIQSPADTSNVTKIA